jgi:uncharacterized repeat protein (TIGR01451 family)
VIVGSPRLTITKTADRSSASEGDTITYTITYSNDSPVNTTGTVITYTITYSNDSPVNTTGTVITDVLPEGLTFVSVQNAGTYDAPSRTITWNVGTLPAGEGPFTVSFTATVTSPYPSTADAALKNTATISSSLSSPANTSVTTFINVPRPYLTLQKSASSMLVNPDSDIMFTLKYANIGTATANGVVLSDVIPTGFTYQGATPAPTSAPAIGGTGTVAWNLGALAPGPEAQVTLTLRPNSPYTASNPTTNTATITASNHPNVSSSYQVAVAEVGCSTSNTQTFYFRNASTNINSLATPIFPAGHPAGNAGTLRYFAQTTAPAANTGISTGPIGIGQGEHRDLVYFFQDPPANTASGISGTVSTSIRYSKGGSAMTFRLYLYSYDPTTGNTFQIGESTAEISTTSSQSNTLLSFPQITATGPLGQGHRLLWRISAQRGTSGTSSVNAEVHFNTTDAYSTLCQTPLNLSLNKTVSQIIAVQGSTLTYTIPFTNTGNAAVTGARIVDTLPVGVTFQSATLNGVSVTPTMSGQQLTFSVHSTDAAESGRISAQQSGTLVITATINQTLDASVRSLTNSATLTSSYTNAVTASATTTLARPNTSINKRASDTLLTPGETVTYTLTVFNTGDAQATNVTINDVLPVTSYFTYVAGSAKLNNATITDPVTGSTLNRNIGTLAAGATAVLTFDMEVARSGVPAGTTVLNNTATVSDAQTATSRSSDPVSVTVSSIPNLRLDKSISGASGGSLKPSDIITYVITASNVGASTAEGVLIRDPIPANTTLVLGSFTHDGTPITDGTAYDSANNRVRLNVGTLAAAASTTLTFKVRVNADLPVGMTVITNAANASSSNAAPKDDTVSSTAEVAAPQPELSILKSAPSELPFPAAELSEDANSTNVIKVASSVFVNVGDVVRVGTSGPIITITGINDTLVTLSTAVTATSGTPLIPLFEYKISYANYGNGDATSVTITDTLPSGLAFDSATHGGTLSGNTVTWSLGTVAAGSSGTVTVRVVPTAGGSYTNSATIQASGITPITSNSTTTRLGVLLPSKNTSTPSVTRTSTSSTEATYTVSVRNTWPTSVSGVYVTDFLPLGFTYKQTTSMTGGSCTSPAANAKQPTWGNCTIPAGATLVITFVTNVGTGVDEGTYDNEVTVMSETSASGVFNAQATTAEDVAVVVTVIAGVSVHGLVYHDVNTNSLLDTDESWADGSQVTLNLVQGGAVTHTATVLAGSGSFELELVPPGQYTLVVTNDEASTAAAPPTGWLFINPPTGQVAVEVGSEAVSGITLGLFHGSRVTGNIFIDDGLSTGTPSDALRNGAERPMPNLPVTAGTGTFARTSMSDGAGSYTLYVPNAWGENVSLSHPHQPATGHNNGSVAYTAQSAADPNAAKIELLVDSGTTYTRNFGVVPATLFAPDQSGHASSPGVIGYTHRLKPGMPGTVTLSGVGSFTYQFFLDGNCDGEVSSAERTPLTTISVTDSWRDNDGQFKSCAVEVRVLVPHGVPHERMDVAMVHADLAWLGAPHAVIERRSLTDLTTITNQAGLKLDKRVRNVTQGTAFASVGTGKPGDELEYCIDYANLGVETITDVVITDPVPFFTDFVSSGNATLIAGIVTLNSPSLAANGQGSTCYLVKIR